METVYSTRPLLAICVSLLAVPILLSSRTKNIRDGWTFAAAICKFLIVASMVPMVLKGVAVEYTLAEVLPSIALKFRVDAAGILFALVASFLWIVTSAYSVGYMRALKEHNQTRYYAYFAVSLSATTGVAFSGNLMTLYLFYEMLSLSTWPLVTHHQDRKARSSGRKYLVYILGSSIVLLLPAMLVIWNATGTLDFAPQGFLAGHLPQHTLLLLLLMFLFGFAKGGVMPFHAWLPAAMVAPTPVSALLHAVAVVKVGAFCIIRVITGVFGTGLLSSLRLGTVAASIAAVTIIAASLIALSQDELKRRLAFSTIGQLSYIILGTALLSPSGITGSMLHIAMHAFGKITLFFCAGALYVTWGITHITQMDGIGKEMPVTMTAFFAGSLSVIGLPPCGGFISKWHLLLGTVESGRPLFLFVLLASSLLNAAYLLPIVYKAFFRTGITTDLEIIRKKNPVWCLVPMGITSLASVLLFLFPQPFLKLARMATGIFLGIPP